MIIALQYMAKKAVTERQILEELLRREQQKFYAQNPLLWLKEKFQEDSLSFEWSKFIQYKNHQWDGDIDPIANAWKSLAKGRWAAISAATGTSKTYFLSRLVYWFLDCFDDSLVVTSAPKEAQLKLHLWAEIGRSFSKFKRIRPEAELHKLKLSIGNATDEEDLYDGWQAVGFVAGTGADETSATKAQGFHRKHMLIITEETPGMSGPVMTAFQNTSTGGHNLIIAVGNPDSELDELAVFSQQSHVDHYRISALDYPNVVIGKEIFPGAVTQTSINIRKDKYGEESPLYKSRVRGIAPKQSSDSLIHVSWIDQCIGLTVKDDIFYYNAMGVDVANSDNGDTAGIAYGKGSSLVEIIEFPCPSASDLAYNILYSAADRAKIRKELLDRGIYAQREYLSAKDTNLTNKETMHDYPVWTAQEFNVDFINIGIDPVGVGASTVNTFTNLGFECTPLSGGDKQWDEAIPVNNEGLPLYKFANLRAQMYFELREDLRNAKISIQVSDQDKLKKVKKQLSSIKFAVKDNAIQIEKKDDIKKRLGESPTYADIMAYWNWMRKGYRVRNMMALPIIS